jgi:hypothetical protein
VLLKDRGAVVELNWGGPLFWGRWLDCLPKDCHFAGDPFNFAIEFINSCEVTLSLAQLTISM